MSKPIPELNLLHRRDPTAINDEWPEYELSNVYVHLPSDPTTPVSLLSASVGYPLTVIGQLEPLDDADAHLYIRPPTKKRVTIELTDVMTFSYGEDDAGYPVWAAGKAGWFKIRPGRSYRKMFAQMEKAVELWYFIADSYQEERKQGRGKKAVMLPEYTAEELLQKFAKEKLDHGSVEEAMDVFNTHKEFIVSCMLAGKEGLEWKKYPLWDHMRQRFPDLFKELKARRKAKAVKPRRQGSVETSSSTTSTVRKKEARAKGGLSNTVEVISLDGSDTTEARQEEQLPKKKLTRTSSAKEIIATPAKDSDSDSERYHAFNKSGLRPRASKANKSAARKGKQPLPASEDDEDEDHQPDDQQEDPNESSLLSPPNLPNSSPTTKRKAPASSTNRPLKRPHTSDSDEGIEIPPSPPPDPSTLSHVPDPLQEDTWICALAGCNHKVYAASHPDSQRLIREHYALHAYDDDSRVQLVKACAAPSLPAGHLMERVRLLAKGEGFPASWAGGQGVSRFPATIVKRY